MDVVVVTLPGKRLLMVPGTGFWVTTGKTLLNGTQEKSGQAGDIQEIGRIQLSARSSHKGLTVSPSDLRRQGWPRLSISAQPVSQIDPRLRHGPPKEPRLAF